MTINERLKLIRESYKESQSKYCRRFNLSQQTYSNYELDGKIVPDSLKEKLYQQGVNINWLVTGEGEMFRDVVDGSSSCIREDWTGRRPGRADTSATPAWCR